MCVDEHTCCDPSHCTSMSVLFSWQSLHSGQNNSEAHFLPQEETSSANRGQRKLGRKSGLYYVFLLMTHFASIQMRSQLLCMAISAFVESFFFKSGVYETTIFMILKKGIVSKMSYTVEENSSFITVICYTELPRMKQKPLHWKSYLFSPFSRKIYICWYYCCKYLVYLFSRIFLGLCSH